MTSLESGGQPKITAPVQAAQVHAAHNPEFVDTVGLRELFGIKRSLAYQLLDEGLIQSVSLRRRGQIRGKRLFNVCSVRSFLQSLQGEIPESSLQEEKISGRAQ